LISRTYLHGRKIYTSNKALNNSRLTKRKYICQKFICLKVQIYIHCFMFYLILNLLTVDKPYLTYFFVDDLLLFATRSYIFFTDYLLLFVTILFYFFCR
jgi:hypothetical protein